MSKLIDIEANISGIVWMVHVVPGTIVAEDDPVITLESMKMEIPLGAPCDGEIVEILVTKDEAVAEGSIVARLRA